MSETPDARACCQKAVQTLIDAEHTDALSRLRSQLDLLYATSLSDAMISKHSLPWALHEARETLMAIEATWDGVFEMVRDATGNHRPGDDAAA